MTSALIPEVHQLPDSEESRHILIDFLRDMDLEFKPSISAQCSLSTYADKLLRFGCILVLYSDTAEVKIAGGVGLYANDHISKCAYVSFIGVRNNMRGRGYARLLLQTALSCATANGMERVRLRTWSDNTASLALFRSVGFQEDECLLLDDGTEKVVLLLDIKNMTDR